MVQHGHELLGAAWDLAGKCVTITELIPDLQVLDDELIGVEASHDLDCLQRADGRRDRYRLSGGRLAAGEQADRRRHVGPPPDTGHASFADDKSTTDRLLDALCAGARRRGLRLAATDQPSVAGRDRARNCTTARDAFFGPVEMVSAHKASGRIAAEQITPYPPGIPAVVPGERLNDAVVDYLRTGLAAGMTCPDPADRSLQTFRVVA